MFGEEHLKHDGRSRFVHAYLQRAAAYQRITALSSASIELHAHQVEAARRVLSDVTQRYLLADEVGLGKTIEAGILIRQHLLDNAPGSVLVAVPPALTSQWRRELVEKLDPATPGHTLVIPRKHVVDLWELEPSLGADLMAAVIELDARSAMP